MTMTDTENLTARTLEVMEANLRRTLMNTITNQPELASVVLKRCQLLKTAMRRLAGCELGLEELGVDLEDIPGSLAKLGVSLQTRRNAHLL